VNIKIRVCQIIGPAAAGSAGPVPTALVKCVKGEKVIKLYVWKDVSAVKSRPDLMKSVLTS